MTQLYTALVTVFLSVMYTSLSQEVVTKPASKLQPRRMNFSLVSLVFTVLSASQQALMHNVIYRIFKMQHSYVNPYLAYASNQGSGGGGGGGGHGNFVLRMPSIRFQPIYIHSQF